MSEHAEEESGGKKACTFFKKSGKRGAVRKRLHPSSDEGLSLIVRCKSRNTSLAKGYQAYYSR